MIRTDAIPENSKGKQTDLFATKSFHTIAECLVMFHQACERLLLPALWAQFAGNEKATFDLFDDEGNKVDRNMKAGDYIRIDLPGPGTRAGDGYDWVQPSLIDKKSSKDGSEDFLAILMHPSHPPQKGNTAAHFFTTESSSTLVVHRKENKITTSHHGRNEVINNHTESAVDNIRNTLVATGARWGLSEIQWTALIEGLLSD